MGKWRKLRFHASLQSGAGNSNRNDDGDTSMAGGQVGWSMGRKLLAWPSNPERYLGRKVQKETLSRSGMPVVADTCLLSPSRWGGRVRFGGGELLSQEQTGFAL